MPLAEAVMPAEPMVKAVTKPSLTPATLLLLDDQLTDLFAALEGETVAVYCVDKAPTGRLSVDGLLLMVTPLTG